MSKAKDLMARRKKAIRLAKTYPEGAVKREELMNYAKKLLDEAESADDLTTDEVYGLMAD